MKTEILTQLCDILGLTDESKLPQVVKSLHDRYGDAVWPNRGVIPCFCGDITHVTREKLGARPDEPVFAAAERVVAQREALAETLSSVKAELEHTRVLLGISRELCAEGTQKIDELKQELARVRADVYNEVAQAHEEARSHARLE